MKSSEISIESFPNASHCSFSFIFVRSSITLLIPFLVGAFSFKEKSPTITVASLFFFFFVRPQSSSRMYHFLQKLISSLRPSSTNANLLQRVPLFAFYLFALHFATESMLMNPKGSPLFIFWRYATFSKFFSKKIFEKKFFKKLFKVFLVSSREK